MQNGAHGRANGWRLDWGSRTFVMGVVNVTGDSFSGDGLAAQPEKAASLAREHEMHGADIVDVGGESTRPGATPVPEEEELRRVIPAIESIAAGSSIPVSIDTTKAFVGREALRAGATVVNDVSGLQRDAAMAAVLKETGAGVVIMHSRRARRYPEVVDDVMDFLEGAVAAAVEVGISKDQIVVDPGFGFAKSPEENIALLRHLGRLKVLKLPVLVGTSRKSTIGAVLGLPVDDRLEGTLATVALAIANGADMVRVHDVKAGVRVARMSDAVVRGWQLEQPAESKSPSLGLSSD